MSLPPLPDLLRRLGCTPAEALALLVLATGAVVLSGVVWFAGQPASGPAVPAASAPTEGPTALAVAEAEVVVHVAGRVRRPGVYTLPGGSRVADAIDAAGGTRPRAETVGLNLARPLADGEQVLVPSAPAPGREAAAGPAAPAAPVLPPASGAPTAELPAAAAPAPGTAAAPATLVNLNTATAAELEALPDIGPILAGRIIAYRDQVGGFTEVGQLREVTGIGEKTFQSIAPLVTV